MRFKAQFVIRKIQAKIERLLFTGNLIVILGPRQSGKTTLSKHLIEKYNNSEYFDCQLAGVRKYFEVGKPDLLLELIKGKKIVVFDEAQTIEDIGTILKVFHDKYKDLGTQIIATGSSSFDLSNKIVEPMTGRAHEFILLPLSLEEIKESKKVIYSDLMQLMQYGSYPKVVASKTLEEKELAIKNIATNYLYKDIFIFQAIKRPKVFEDLLKLLALQIGQLVSVNELAKSLGASRTLVERYLRLLEQSFIIKVIHSFSNNPRNELKKAFKVYFVDLGVRNALVDILAPVENRSDKGGLFENFIFNEKQKNYTLETFPPNLMFWRNRKGLEIDFIEKQGEKINALECKWQEEKVVFTKFLKKYKNANCDVMTIKKMLD